MLPSFLTMSPVARFVGLRFAGATGTRQLVGFISRVSTAGLAIGVGLLIVVLSVMNGFDRELRERILAIVPHVSLYAPVAGGLTDWAALIEQVEQKQGVVSATPFVELQGMARSGKQVEPVLVYGAHAELEKTVSIIDQFIAAEDYQAWASDTQSVLVGRLLAEQLRINKGDHLSLFVPSTASEEEQSLPHMASFTVAGIFDTNTEVDRQLLLMNLDTARELAGRSGVDGLRLRTDNLFSAPRIAYQLEESLDGKIIARDWSSTHGSLFMAIQTSRQLVSLLLFLIIAVAAFNVVSTLVLVVIDKQPAIAILRSVGASGKDIMGIFMIQGVIITLTGVAIGALFGSGLSLVLPEIVAWAESLFGFKFLKGDVYPITYVPSDLRFEDVLIISGAAMAMGLLATLFPAWKATRVRPAEVLRHE